MIFSSAAKQFQISVTECKSHEILHRNIKITDNSRWKLFVFIDLKSQLKLGFLILNRKIDVLEFCI